MGYHRRSLVATEVANGAGQCFLFLGSSKGETVPFRGGCIFLVFVSKLLVSSQQVFLLKLFFTDVTGG